MVCVALLLLCGLLGLGPLLGAERDMLFVLLALALLL